MQPHQSIAYYRNDRLVTTLTDERFSMLPLELAVHIRYEQLLMERSLTSEEILQIPLPDGTIWRSTPINFVEPVGNALLMTSERADYQILCNGIDIGRMRADGKNQGVNAKPPAINSYRDITHFPTPRG